MNTKVWLFLGILSLGTYGYAGGNAPQVRRAEMVERYIAEVARYEREIIFVAPFDYTMVMPHIEVLDAGETRRGPSPEQKARVYTLGLALTVVYAFFMRFYGCSRVSTQGPWYDACLVALVLIWLMVYREEGRLRHAQVQDLHTIRARRYVRTGTAVIRTVRGFLCNHREQLSVAIAGGVVDPAITMLVDVLRTDPIYDAAQAHPELFDDQLVPIVAQVLQVVHKIIEDIAAQLNWPIDAIEDRLGELFYDRDVVMYLHGVLAQMTAAAADLHVVGRLTQDLGCLHVVLGLLLRGPQEGGAAAPRVADHRISTFSHYRVAPTA